MRNIGLRIEYDGSRFQGYQRQKDAAVPTVQGILEDLLSSILQERVEAVCAGRTDSGVHAVGQVVHIRTGSSRPLSVIERALWRTAHGRIAVSAAWEAPPWFHARHNAARRIYQYHLLCQDQPSPLLSTRTWHVWRPLSIECVAAEARSLLGRRDFKAFQSGADVDHYFRTLYRIDVHRVEAQASPSYLRAPAPLICVEVEADAFLPHMVRMLMGTLVDVGVGQRPRGTAAAALRSRDSRASSAAAPPQGLCLVRVEYPPACGVPL